MGELFALGIYLVQWLGVVLGVGAAAVLLVGHLAARHARRPDWLSAIPAVRAVQGLGLLLMVASGLAAVLYQFSTDTSVLFIPTFGFKWALIALCVLTFWLEGLLKRGSAWLEGFAGATWLALFMVHSVAPIAQWVDLLFAYGLWLASFYVLWGISVWAAGARHAAAPAPVPPKPKPIAVSMPAPAPKPALSPPPVPEIKPVITPAPPPPPSKPQSLPAPKPALEPVHKITPPPAPVVHAPAAPAHIEVHAPHVSLWKRIAAWFGVGKHHSVPQPTKATLALAPTLAEVPTMARVSAPVPLAAVARVALPRFEPMPTPAPAPAQSAPSTDPNHLPVVEYLELLAPQAPKPPSAPKPAYKPDYDNLPGVTVMPQKPEDVPRQNRAPLVQGL